jgi:outer membrane lipopolysaccharide assembly protein LptE/RlpB
MRSKFISGLAMAGLIAIAGCGYHQVGAGSHIPAGVRTVAVPMFENRTQLPHLETWMTQATERELTMRTKLAVVPKTGDADAVLKGVILTETALPLTYTSNSTTTTTSSYVITMTAKVTLTDAHGNVLFENDNYSFRQVYESTEQLSSFIEEDSPALQRLARDFAKAVVSDMLESF